MHLVGQLEGGYLPPGGALVRLRIGIGAARTTYGIREHVGGDGRFSTSYTFGLGDPSLVQAYWFQIASLPMGNYPYAPASSQRITVIVGGQPASVVSSTPSRTAPRHRHARRHDPSRRRRRSLRA